MATRVVLTYKDYEALPADGRRYELHEGELSVTPAPSPRHQEVSLNLGVVLHNYVKTRSLGKVLAAPIDCILSDTTIVQPDIVYIETARLGAISARGIEGAPTLVRDPLAIDRADRSEREVPTLRPTRGAVLLDCRPRRAQHRSVPSRGRNVPDRRAPGGIRSGLASAFSRPRARSVLHLALTVSDASAVL